MGLFDPDRSASRLPVSVITGFLGSGKTTLLNKLLRHPGMGDSAVIINEFGEVGLDHLLVEAVEKPGERRNSQDMLSDRCRHPIPPVSVSRRPASDEALRPWVPQIL